MSTDLSNLMAIFCKETICGLESGYYKVAHAKVEEDIEINNDSSTSIDYSHQVVKNHLTVYVVEHFNKIYRTLINGEDDYFTSVFHQMFHSEANSQRKHGYLCLLKIACAIVGTIIMNINRDLFNVSTHETFMLSMTTEVERLISTMVTVDSIYHDGFPCDTQDIKTCDPNVKLFNIKVTNLDENTNENNNENMDVVAEESTQELTQESTQEESTDPERPYKKQKMDIE